MAVTVPDASYPYAYDITARQADTYSQQFTFTGQDFTGYTLSFRVMDLYDKRPILTITPTLTGTNTITVLQTAVQMDVRSGRYRYVFEATDGSAVNVEYLKGVFSILDDVNDSASDTIDDGLVLDTANDTILVIEAGEDIISHTPIAIISGLAYKFDSSNAAHVYNYAGFSIIDSDTGENAHIQQLGLLTKAGWGLTANVPYYAGADGTITTSDSPAGFVFRKIVGVSVSTETMMISQNIQPYGALIDL